MAARDAHSYFIRKKAEKKDSQVQIPQLVNTSDNVTVAEMSPINTEIKNSCKELTWASLRKLTSKNWLRKSKTKLVNMRTDMEQRR